MPKGQVQKRKTSGTLSGFKYTILITFEQKHLTFGSCQCNYHIDPSSDEFTAQKWEELLGQYCQFTVNCGNEHFHSVLINKMWKIIYQMTYRFQILIISLGTSQKKIYSLLITTLCCHDDTLWYMYLMSHQRFSVVTELSVNTKYPMLKILTCYHQQA